MSHSIRRSSMEGPRGMTMTSFDQDQLLGETIKCRAIYERCINQNQNWDAYKALLRIRDITGKMSEGRIKAREQIWTYQELASVSVTIRDERRILANRTCLLCCLNVFWCLPFPCSAYYCCKLSCGETKWVDDDTLVSYINQTNSIAKRFIKDLSDQHKIKMKTKKSKVPELVRKDIAYAYSQMAYVVNLNEKPFDSCACCCEMGSIVCERSPAKAVTFFREAAAWDPTEEDYAAHAQKLDAYMKTPIVNITYTS